MDAPVLLRDAHRARSFLHALARRERPDILARSIAVVVAHPDDETIGIGGQLSRLKGPVIVHVTDGAPRNLQDARAYGFESAFEYAEQRRRELREAMATAGVSPASLLCLGVSDQEAGLELVETARRLAFVLAQCHIGIVLTHPYEGGHPDHDATAFAAHAAAALMARDGLTPPAIIEMAFYHADSRGLVTQRFAEGTGASETVIPLDEESWRLKQRMIAAHVTQRQTLAPFNSSVERFRPAPEYDFGALPNRGRLYYERFDWGMTGARWLVQTSSALRALDLGDVL